MKATTRHAAAHAAVLTLAGCAATVEPIQAPSGGLGHIINCTNCAGWGACFETAAQVCAGPYDVIAQNSGVEGVSGSTPVYQAGGGYTMNAWGSTWETRTLVVECGGAS